MNKARLIIADDHQVVRQGLRDMISRTHDLSVMAEAADGAEAETLAASLEADLLILDVALPVRRGIQVLESLRARGTGIPILFFSMYPASQYREYIRRAGAQGFIGKDASSSEVVQAIRRVLAGGLAFGLSNGDAAEPATADNALTELSGREFEVLQKLIRGMPIHDIAAGMQVSPQTVTTYRRRLMDKLGVQSNAELVALVIRNGGL